MLSREFFEQVREASIDAERIRCQLAQMESREGVRTQRYEPRVSGGTSDPMRATDARIDREGELRKRIEGNYALIDTAHDIIYGPDGEGGVASLLGTATADAMYWRYCAAVTWPEVAKAVCYSRAWCHKAVSVAHDTIDSLGIDAVMKGRGTAEL